MSTLQSEQPDLILLGESMADEVADLIPSLTEQGHSIAVLTGMQKGQELRETYLAGVRGYISIDIPAEQFQKSIELLLQGATVFFRETR
ncbi:MAG: hypothetical protein ACOC9B_06485 [Chloroflexota bacterium]